MKKIVIGFTLIFFAMISSGCDLKNRIDQKMSENKNEIIENNNNDNTKQDNSSPSIQNKETSDSQNILSNNKEKQIENYFESEADYITNMSKTSFETIKDKAINFTKDSIDFIFYNKEINGITFKELTEETKQKIINIVNKVDEKIMEYDPDYKETIDEKYQNIKEITKNGIEKGKDKIKESIGQNTYDDIIDKSKEIIEKDKEIISDLWDKTKNWFDSKRS